MATDANEHTHLINNDRHTNACSHDNNNNNNNNKSDRDINPYATSPCPYTIQSRQESAIQQGDVIHDSQEKLPDNNPRKYSKTKVRLLLPLISALYFSRGSLRSLVFQYLLERWSLEAGHNSTVSVGDQACDRNESDPSFQAANAIQSRVAEASMYYSWCSSFPGILTCALIGAVIDLVGRKSGLVLSQLGSILQLVTIILVIRFELHPDLFYLAYGLEGIGGGMFVYLLSLLATTADVSGDKESRITWIIIFKTSTSIFSSACDVGVGYVINQAGYTYAAITLLIPTSLAIFLTVVALPETLPPTGRTFAMKKLWTHNTHVVSLYLRDGSKAKRWCLFLSLMIIFTNTFNLFSLSSTDTLYQKHEPLCWDSQQIGYWSAFRSASHGLCGFGYLWLSRRIGCASDEVNAMVSLLFMAGSFVLEAFVRTSWEMYMVPVIAIPSANVDSITRGVMSYLVGPEKQGVLFSSLALLELLCEPISNTAYSNAYAYTVDVLPGAVYFVRAGISLVTFLIYIPFFHFYERPPKTYQKL